MAYPGRVKTPLPRSSMLSRGANRSMTSSHFYNQDTRCSVYLWLISMRKHLSWTLCILRLCVHQSSGHRMNLYDIFTIEYSGCLQTKLVVCSRLSRSQLDVCLLVKRYWVEVKLARWRYSDSYWPCGPRSLRLSASMWSTRDF